MSIPSIDLAQYSTLQDLANAIKGTLKNVGFLIFVNHGLETAAENMFKLSEENFKALTPEDKQKFHRGKDNRGYMSTDEESLDPASGVRDAKEVFNVGCGATPASLGGLPSVFDTHREALWNFQKDCHDLGQKLLESFALALDLPQDTFSKGHDISDETVDTLRFLKYAPIQADKAETIIRAGQHTDYGSITLLFQRNEGWDGLQVNLGDGWQNVPVPKNGLVVNVADALEFWSGGIFRSTLHRVVLSSQGFIPERYSIAFFNQPLPKEPLDPLLTSKDASAINRVESKGVRLSTKLNSGEYLNMRLDASIKV